MGCYSLNLSLCFYVLLVGCGANVDILRRTAKLSVVGAAHSIALVDGQVARLVTEEAADPSRVQGVAARWEPTVVALEHARGVVVAADALVDRGGDVCDALPAVRAAWQATVAVPRLLPPGVTLAADFAASTDRLLGATEALTTRCSSGGAR